MKILMEKIVCPYCGKAMKVDVPEPEESMTYEVDVKCGNCKNKVSIPILPKFKAKPF